MKCPIYEMSYEISYEMSYEMSYRRMELCCPLELYGPLDKIYSGRYDLKEQPPPPPLDVFFSVLWWLFLNFKPKLQKVFFKYYLK